MLTIKVIGTFPLCSYHPPTTPHFVCLCLTLKAPITTAADDIHKYFFIVFSEKIRLDVSSESSARQRIHLKNQAVFSSRDKSKKLKCRLLQFLFGALRVNNMNTQGHSVY